MTPEQIAALELQRTRYGVREDDVLIREQADGSVVAVLGAAKGRPKRLVLDDQGATVEFATIRS